MRILIIEDDDDIREVVAGYLQLECFAVDVAATGSEGSYLAAINDYDLIILDCMLPDTDGLEVCKEIRSYGKTVPILVLSGICDTDNKVALLDHGADDYMTKPFSLIEIRSRIAALLRRPVPMVSDIMTVAHLTIDPRRQKVLRNKTEIYLTRKEFSLLEYLARNKETVVSRSMIMEHVWNMESSHFSNTIEAHIFNLRKKLVRKDDPPIIHTVPGRGYRFGGAA